MSDWDRYLGKMWTKSVQLFECCN